MTSHLSSVVTAIKDAGNPFIRLINNATSDLSTLGIPYYQAEEIKEAAFQSQNACETIHKALATKLESANDTVVRKTLEICKLLLLEGPNPQFQTLMFQQTAGKVYNLANLHKTEPDRHIPKDSVLEGNVKLAGAIHRCITGDRNALASYGVGQQSRSAMGAPSGAGTAASFKSDFQAQQEREQKNFKKRREEERARMAGVVTTEKMAEQFDSTLSPAKLVEYAVNHPKKKFTDEELENFVEAAEENGKVEEISVALDKVLRDGKSSLQNRYKVLTIVDVMMRNLPAALKYFQNNNTGIYRHLAIEAGDNPTKSAMTQQLSASIMEIVHGKVKVPASQAARGGSEEAAQNTTAAPANPSTTFQYSNPSLNTYGTPTTSAKPTTYQTTGVAPTRSNPPTATTGAQQPSDQQHQLQEMMRKMQEMQAQINAQTGSNNGFSASATTSNASPAPGVGGWGAPSTTPAVSSPYANSGIAAWGDNASTQSVWGSATSMSGWGNPSASPSVSAQPLPTPKRDVLDDLFDSSVPAPTNTGFSGGVAQQRQSQQPASPLVAPDTHNQRGDASPTAEDFTSVATVLPQGPNDFASPKESDLPQRPNNSVNLTGSFVAGLQLQPTSATNIEANATQSGGQPQQLQQPFSQQNSQYGAQQLTPTTSFAVSPHPEYITPPQASKEDVEANAAMLQIKQMQEKMAQMMLAMQQQQQQQGKATDTAHSVGSPVMYTDPQSAGFPAFTSAPIAAPAPTTAPPARPSRRPEIIRLMGKLEEQIATTREILSRQQSYMKSLQEALMAEN